MSRASRKSGLSPSITKGSGSGIDLGKNSGVDMGQKSQPSITSGGIGVTHEVTNIGGMSVRGGVAIDLTPVNIGINIDPSENTISVATGAEVPGGLLGISGGIEIDLNTGQVIGGSIGGEVGGLGVNVSNSKEGGLGVEFTLQIPGTPIELSLGFGLPSTPTPPTPTPEPTTRPGVGSSAEEILPLLRDECQYHMIGYAHGAAIEQIFDKPLVYIKEHPEYKGGIWTSAPGAKIISYKNLIKKISPAYIEWHDYPFKNRPGYKINITNGFGQIIGFGSQSIAEIFGDKSISYPGGTVIYGLYGGAGLKKVINNYNSTVGAWEFSVIQNWCPNQPPNTPPKQLTPVRKNSLPSSSPSPFPNPPPRKRNMDECCRTSIALLRRIHQHLGVSPVPGMESLEQFAGVKTKGEAFQGDNMAFPFEVPRNWLDVLAKREEKITVKNLSELLLVMGAQSERLERVLGTREFIKDSEGKLRQSEGNILSWLSGKNPDFAYPDPNDFWLDTDDGIIKEKRLEVRNLTDAVRYVVEMGNRLERILPIAELKDSSIPKRWIYPGAKGQERVGNLIHLIELMVRADDKHRGYWPVKVKVKDADPAIKGDQPIELEFHSQADVFRELFQYLIDMEGDGDLTSNFALRGAFQTCQLHQLAVQNNAMLDAIVEYLDFKVNRTTARVPMPFDPFAGMDKSLAAQILEKIGFTDGASMIPSIDSNKESDIEELAPNILQNTIVDVDIIECDEEKTLNEALLELLKHSSAASAAVSERVSEPAIDRLIAGAGLAQKVTSFLLRRDVASALGIGDLDKWISSAEAGYTENPETQSLRFPESDPLQPYGRPIEENPRIREIDTKNPKAD